MSLKEEVLELRFSLSHCFLSLSLALSHCVVHTHTHTLTENAIHAYTHLNPTLCSVGWEPQHWALMKRWPWTFCCQSHPTPAEYHHRGRLRLQQPDWKGRGTQSTYNPVSCSVSSWSKGEESRLVVHFLIKVSFLGRLLLPAVTRCSYKKTETKQGTVLLSS